MVSLSGPDLQGRVLGVELVTQVGQRNSPLTYDDIYEVIENLLELDIDELEAIQMHGPDPNRVDITIATLEVWNRRNINGYLERKFCLNNNKTVRLVQPCENVANIRIKRVPSWWRESDIRRVIGFYGNIRDVYPEKYRNNIDPNNTYNNNIKDIYRKF